MLPDYSSAIDGGLSDTPFYLLCLFGIICFAVVIILFVRINPFEFPYYTVRFDSSETKESSIEYYVDEFIKNGNFDKIRTHQGRIEEWKKACEKQIARSVLRSLRRRQYLSVLDEDRAFQFILCEKWNRHRRVSLSGKNCRVNVEVKCRGFSYEYLLSRYKRLSADRRIDDEDDGRHSFGGYLPSVPHERG